MQKSPSIQNLMLRKIQRNSLFISILFLPILANSKVTIEDYQRADSTKNYENLVYHSVLEMEWIDSTVFCGYKINTRNGYEYWIIDTKKFKKKPAFNTNEFCNKLNQFLGTTKYNPKKIPLKKFRILKDLFRCEFMLEDNQYQCDLKKLEFKKLNEPEKKKEEYWGNSFDELGNEPVISPDSTYKAYIKDYNVYIKKRSGKKETQLSYDGSEGEFYSSYIHWSPDSKKLAVFKVRDNKKRYMYFVESAPEDQLLPRLHKREYLRPGDALPIKSPCLFNIENKQQIPVSNLNYADQYNLDNIQWSNDSKSFSFEYNQRGHQVYQVISIDAETGEETIIINETSKTFIDYSSKRYRYDLKEEQQIIWASERDGWNHLYLINAESGNLIRQITKGNWVVRGVLHVDEKNKKILFEGSGMNPDEDPYFVHYYWINFDGSGLLDLTPEKLNHKAVFATKFDQPYFIDTYSTVSDAPVTVMRDFLTGEIKMDIEKADISKLMEAGYIFPEPFVAKGRDGKTDISGNIYRPSNFDSTKSYPVIEYIYAGPQSSFVQKSFQPYHYKFTGLAELGFIIVQIDGMGTSNRSKAFHDVCYKNLKDAGFADRILWMKEAARTYSYMDTSRVGIFGGSAGGQNSTAALLFHPGFYKVGVSSCGCHDNRVDKIWWNEQWMGYPIESHYTVCSNVENAGRLEGKLMLIVGEIDDNVDPASTYQLVNALIKEKKEFELVVLPGVGHTLGGDYGERKRRDFFVKNLLLTEPPTWNK